MEPRHRHPQDARCLQQGTMRQEPKAPSYLHLHSYHNVGEIHGLPLEKQVVQTRLAEDGNQWRQNNCPTGLKPLARCGKPGCFTQRQQVVSKQKDTDSLPQKTSPSMRKPQETGNRTRGRCTTPPHFFPDPPRPHQTSHFVCVMGAGRKCTQGLSFLHLLLQHQRSFFACKKNVCLRKR